MKGKTPQSEACWCLLQWQELKETGLPVNCYPNKQVITLIMHVGSQPNVGRDILEQKRKPTAEGQRNERSSLSWVSVRTKPTQTEGSAARRGSLTDETSTEFHTRVKMQHCYKYLWQSFEDKVEIFREKKWKKLKIDVIYIFLKTYSDFILWILLPVASRQTRQLQQGHWCIGRFQN